MGWNLEGARWTRVYRGGWLSSCAEVLSVVLAVGAFPVALAISLATLIGGHPDLLALCEFWVVAAWAFFGVWRLARYGTWSSDDGLRIDRLLRWDRIPWRRVRGFVVEQHSSPVGRPLRRTVLETTQGERIALPGTNWLLTRVFVADSPEMARHRLDRERRYYLRRQLPHRRPLAPAAEEVIDLRPQSTRIQASNN